MKARDLAALAALGVAGYAAYNKFGKKKSDQSGAKEGAKLGKSGSANDGEEGEAQTRMDNYSNEGRGKAAKFADEDYSNEGRSAKFANEDYSNEGRGSVAPDYSNEGRGKVKKEIEYPLFPRPVAKKETVAKPVVQRSNEDYSNEGYNRAPATALSRLNEANGAASESARITDALAVGSRANQAAYLKDKQAQALVPDYSNEGRNRPPVTALSRINETGGASTPSARATDALAVGSRANQAAYKKAQLETQAANAQAQARMMRQGSPMAASRRNAGMPGYDEAGNPISMRSMAGQRGFDEAGNKMKRGGMVKKMASGGMTSSKPSTASSRGDGIAQRGKTRGKLC